MPTNPNPARPPRDEAGARRRRWRPPAVALCGVLLAACGGSAASPATPESSTVSVAPDRATPIDPPTTPVCGGFEQLTLDAAPTPLLAGRLQLIVPPGAEVSARPTNIMQPDAAVEMETRIMLSEGDQKLVVFSQELGALAPPSLHDVLAVAPRLQDADLREARLESGLPVLFAVERELRLESDAVPLAHAFTTLDDGTVQATRVFVNPAVVSAASAGCMDLALRMLSTLAPGGRKLDLFAGDRQLDGGFVITLPAGYLVSTERGPDFLVHRFLGLREMGATPPEMGVYVGGHPNYSPDPSATQLPATILGQSVSWNERQSDGMTRRETLVDLGTLSLHLFMGAPETADVDALTLAASSLRRSQPPP